jgi:hypothetical protein
MTECIMVLTREPLPFPPPGWGSLPADTVVQAFVSANGDRLAESGIANHFSGETRERKV